MNFGLELFCDLYYSKGVVKAHGNVNGCKSKIG